MTNRDPYRDERASLVAENERLRAALGAQRRAFVGAAVRWLALAALVGLHVTGLSRALDLLNAARDGAIASGAAILVGLLVIDVAFGVWWTSRKG